MLPQFAVPPSLVATVMQNMHGLGLREENEAVPWQEVMPTTSEEWPRIALRGGRCKEGLTQAQLSQLTGIPRAHISAMENNRRPIGKENARILAQTLNIDPNLFLNV